MARIRRTGSGNTGTSSRYSGRTSTSTSRKHTNQRATRNTGKTSSSGNTRKTSSSSKKSTNGISGKAVSGSKGASQTQAKHRQVRNDTFVSAKSIPQNKQIQNVDSKQIRNKDLSNENKKENKDTVSLSNHYRVYTLQSQNTGNHIKSLEPSVKKNSRSAEAKTDEKETAEVQKNRTDSFERSSRLRIRILFIDMKKQVGIKARIRVYRSIKKVVEGIGIKKDIFLHWIRMEKKLHIENMM